MSRPRRVETTEPVKAANDAPAMPRTGSQYDGDNWKRSSALTVGDSRDDMPAPAGFPASLGRLES